jgi:hypothetical protein
MSKNNKSLIVRWNLAAQATFPHLYAAANRPGRVVVNGNHGTHLGNNSFVTYDGRLVSKKLTPAKDLTKTFKRMSSHGARELAKGILFTDPEYALDATKRAAALTYEVLQHRFQKSHRVSKLTPQDLMDLFSVISPSLITGSSGLIKNHDRDFEDHAVQVWWKARGFDVDPGDPASIQLAYDGYAARQHATAAQTAIALKNRANEIKQVRLAKRSKKVAPTAELVKTDTKGVPTKKPVTRADATAVLKSV